MRWLLVWGRSRPGLGLVRRGSRRSFGQVELVEWQGWLRQGEWLDGGWRFVLACSQAACAVLRRGCQARKGMQPCTTPLCSKR